MSFDPQHQLPSQSCSGTLRTEEERGPQRQDEEALSLLLLLKSNTAPGVDPSSSTAASGSDSEADEPGSGSRAGDDRDSGGDDTQQLLAEGKQLALLKSLTMERLRRYFHLPINEVARQLGICTTVLKKICRRNNIRRWPYRQIRSITESIQSTQIAGQSETLSDRDRLRYRSQILHLQHTLELLLQDPNAPVSDILRLSSPSDFPVASEEAERRPPTVANPNVAAILAAAAESPYHPPELPNKYVLCVSLTSLLFSSF